MVTASHTNSSKSKNNANKTSQSQLRENPSPISTSKVKTKNNSSASTTSSNHVISASSSGSTSSSSSSASSTKNGKNKTIVTSNAHQESSNDLSPNGKSKRSVIDIANNHSESTTTTTSNHNMKPTTTNTPSPPLKKHKSNNTPENDKEILELKYNSYSTTKYNNIYPALGNASLPVQLLSSTLQNNSNSNGLPPPRFNNFERSSYYVEKPPENRSLDEVSSQPIPVSTHHQYYRNYGDENYAEICSYSNAITSTKKMRNDAIEYHPHEPYNKGPTFSPMRFCVCFIQGHYCSPCHVVHMLMHRYSFPCGIKACEFVESLNVGVPHEHPSNPPSYVVPHPAYSQHPQQPSTTEYAYHNHPSNYYPLPPPSAFPSNVNEYYPQYSRPQDGYYTDHSKFPN